MCPICEPGQGRPGVMGSSRAGLKGREALTVHPDGHCREERIELKVRRIERQQHHQLSQLFISNWSNKHWQSWRRAPASDQVNPVSCWEVRGGTTPGSDLFISLAHVCSQLYRGIILTSHHHFLHKRFLTWTSISEPSLSSVHATDTYSMFMYSWSTNRIGSSGCAGAMGSNLRNST